MTTVLLIVVVLNALATITLRRECGDQKGPQRNSSVPYSNHRPLAYLPLRLPAEFEQPARAERDFPQFDAFGFQIERAFDRLRK
jgi:hypothetical protein